jgi:hypothetical protein
MLIAGIAAKKTKTRANQQRVSRGRVVAGLSTRELPPVARWTSATTGATVQTESHAAKRVTEWPAALQGRGQAALWASRLKKVADDEGERPDKDARHDANHRSGNHHHQPGPGG